jgi:hypothetical protein
MKMHENSCFFQRKYTAKVREGEALEELCALA